MTNKNTHKAFRLLPVAAAMLAAYGNVYAQQSSDVTELITPDSSINVGIGGVNNTQDAKRFGQYTGMNQGTAYGLIDFDLIRRNDATGTWLILKGRNLGLDTREFTVSQQKQGDWKVQFDYNEIVRNDPYVIHTGMTGIGTTTPQIHLIATPPMPAAWATVNALTPSNGIAGTDVELKLKRTAMGLSGEKWLSPELQFELSFRTENKKGARMFGRAGLNSSDLLNQASAGTGNANGSWAVLLTPEPIDSNTQQIEGKLSFNRDKLALTGGYYGSFYTNNNGSLTPNVPNTLNRGVLWNGGVPGTNSTVQQLASATVALPPDNQAHQLYLSGNYAFSDTTRSNFKLSYTHATQNESFAAQGLSALTAIPASLGGVVDTKLAQFGLTMRPSKSLSINASLRYEDRADKTPIVVYNHGSLAQAALNGTTNWPSGSQTRTTAKLDGIYRFASGYSLMLGGDWERKVTPLPPANSAIVNGQVFFRPALNEYGLHAEARKALSVNLNGAVGFEYKQRRGGDNDWRTTTGTAGNALLAFNPGLPATGTSAATAGGNYVLADMYMDRNRTKLRGNMDWEASEKLSLQAVVEHTQDEYLRAIPSVTVLALPQVVPVVAGARTIISDSLSLDTTYTVSEDWRINGFWTHSYNRWNVNKVNIGDDTRNTADTFGLGINGKLSSRLSIGMDILATRDTTTFSNLVAVASATPASNPNAAGNIPGWSGQTMPGNFLPNINYTTDKLNLHAKYVVNKSSDVQALLSWQHFKTDDWQWGYNGVPFVYSDNTTVSQPMNQHLVFVAARYIYKFQ